MNNFSANRRSILSMAGITVVGAAALTACSGKASTASAASTSQKVTMYVFPDSMKVVKGSDGDFHDAFVPSSFVVKAGTPVELEITNYDDMPHTITATEMGLNVMVKAAKTAETDPTTTTHTFTPSKKGTFRWYCALKCDDWAMAKTWDGPGRDGFMAGDIVVM